VIAIDSETTGLHHHKGHVPFLVGYGNSVFSEVTTEFKSIPKVPEVFMHNAVFDLNMLRTQGVEIPGTIYDTGVLARLAYNEHMDYSLDACAERAGSFKSAYVDEYISKHRLYTDIEIAGKKKPIREKHFDLVPKDIITEYLKQDVCATYQVGVKAIKELEMLDKTRLPGQASVFNEVTMESSLVRVLADMNWVGVQIDLDYVREAAEHSKQTLMELESKFKLATGKPFIDSAVAIKAILAPLGFTGGTTDKGNASYDNDYLEQAYKETNSKILGLILEHRSESKKLGSFWSSLLYYANSEGVIGQNFKSSGTKTGRFSSSNPNFQNLSKDDGSIYPVRKAIKARQGFVLVSMDYQAQEYRLLADRANAQFQIDQVLAGKDLHMATAELMKVTRSDAKTIGFGLLYGQGVDLLASNLKRSKDEATRLKGLYFDVLPEIKKYIVDATRVAKQRGIIRNIYGRVYHFPDPSKSYRATNSLIQGASSGITKRAMVACHNFLRPYRSHLLLTIHDELVFEVATDETHLVPKLRELMIGAYKERKLGMDVGIECGMNLHEMVDFTYPLTLNNIHAERDVI